MACNDFPTVDDMKQLKLDSQDENTFMTSTDLTFTTSTGRTILTLTGLLASGQYLPPVPYAAGITFTETDYTKTIERNNIVYAPLPSQIPFTTSGTWTGDDENKFFVVQGLTTSNISTVTDLVFDGVSNLLSDNPIKAPINSYVKTGATTWFRAASSTPTVISDFSPVNPISVKDFGAVGDGSTDDLVSVNSATAVNGYAWLPEGVFFLSAEPNDPAGLFGPGILSNVDLITSPTKQVGDQQILKSYRERTYGRYEAAVSQSITANKDSLGQDKENTSVNGTDAQGLSQRDGRDHVAQYISINNFTPIVLDSTSTYTATTVTNSAILSPLDVKVGMIIDTDHADRFTGIVESIDYGTNTLTVGAWYKQSDGLTGTPASGTGCIVNPNTKVFGQNIIVFANGDGGATGAQEASGIELSVITGSQPAAVPGTFGIDMAIIQDSYIDVGYQIRGKRNFSYWSNNAGGGGLFGFRSDGDNRGFYANDCNIPIEVVTGGQSVYSVTQTGGVTHSGTRTQNAVSTIGSSLRSLTNGTDVITTIVAPQAGGRILITGVNTGTGVPYVEEGIFRTGVFTSIAKSDGSGLTPTLSMNGSTLEFTVSGGTMNYSFEVKKL